MVWGVLMAKKTVKETQIEAKLKHAKSVIAVNVARYMGRDPRLRDLKNETAKRLELARLSGVSRTSINRYLDDDVEGADNGHAALNNLIRLADTFHISVLQLLENVHDVYPAHGEAHPDLRGGGGLTRE